MANTPVRTPRALGKQVGIPPENIVVVENGQVVELADDKLTLAERNPGNYVFVEGDSVGDIDLDVMHARNNWPALAWYSSTYRWISIRDGCSKSRR